VIRINRNGFGGILEANSGSFTGERISSLDIVIDDIGLAYTGIPDEYD